MPLHRAFVGTAQPLAGNGYAPGQIWVSSKHRPALLPGGMPGLSTAAVRADDPEVHALIAALDAYQRPLYPLTSQQALDITALLQPQVRLLVVRDAQEQVLACGAIQLLEDYAELKRMMVLPAMRGQGVAKLLVRALEREAIRAGRPLLRLETGVRQHAALHLYERMGFERCGPFGGYRGDPFSVFMEKLLG